MSIIYTVNGTMDSSELGFTLMHEHVLIINQNLRLAFPDWLDRAEFVDLAVRMLKKAKVAGVGTFVDCTPVTLGRDLALMQEVSEKAEMPIIASTGFFYYEDPIDAIGSKDMTRMTARLVRDIEVGMEGTDRRAMLIKCATDHFGISPANEKMLRIVARAQKETGALITTHTVASSRSGLRQLELFDDEGVDLRKVIVGHTGDSVDLDYIHAILNAGSTIGYDRFGQDWHLPDDSRIRMLKKLTADGYADRIVLSHDFCAYNDFEDHEWSDQRDFDVENEPWQFSYIHETIIPQMLEAGIRQSDIDQMGIETPRRLFESMSV